MSRRRRPAERGVAAWALGALLCALAAMALALTLPVGASAEPDVLTTPGADTPWYPGAPPPGTDGTSGNPFLFPSAPAAGELPDASSCDRPNPPSQSYCLLRIRCEGDLKGELPVNIQACAALKEREQLKTCRANEHTEDPCTMQSLRLKALCAKPDADKALCTEFKKLPVGRATVKPSARDQLCEELRRRPTSAASPQPRCPRLGDGDILGQNGGGSPWCDRDDLDETAKAVCVSSLGAINRAHPLSSYGLDWWIADKLEDPFETLFQSVIEVLWKGVLWLFSSSLLLVDWAFTMDLTAKAMTDIETSILFLHEVVLGPGWMLAGIAVLGLWGIWHGLVRRQTIQTFSGLAMSVMMMVVALIIIHDPRGTVGQVSAWTNDSSVAALTFASVGTVRNPGAAFADSQQRLFNSAVVRPWCAMQFGDASYCDRTWEGPLPGSPFEKVKILGGALSTIGDLGPAAWTADLLRDRADARRCGKPPTLAEAWLCFPANGSRREALYNRLKDEDEDRVVLQEATGALDRVALFVVIAIGLLGATATFGTTGGHLLFAGLETLVLLLLAPVVLILAACGDRGREWFVIYLQRLFGSVLSKFVWAVLFGVLVLVSNIIIGLDGLGFYPQWLLLGAFWWGSFARRDEIITVASFGNRREAKAGLPMYFGYRMARDMAGDAVGVVTAPLRGAKNAGHWGWRQAERYNQAHAEAVAKDADRQLDHEAHERVADRHEADHEMAKDAKTYHEAEREKGSAENKREHVRRHRDEAEGNLGRLEAEQGRLEQAGGPDAPPLDASKVHDADRYHESLKEDGALQRKHEALARASAERARLLAEQEGTEALGPVPPLADAKKAGQYLDTDDQLTDTQRRREQGTDTLTRARDERDRLTGEQLGAQSTGSTNNARYEGNEERIRQLNRIIPDLEQQNTKLDDKIVRLETQRDGLEQDLGGVPDRATATRALRYHANEASLAQMDAEHPDLAGEMAQVDGRIQAGAGERRDIETRLGGTPDADWSKRAMQHAANEDRIAQTQSAITAADAQDQTLTDTIDDNQAKQDTVMAARGWGSAEEVPDSGWSNRIAARERDIDGNPMVTQSEVRDERAKIERELDEASPNDRSLDALRRHSANARGAEYVDGASRNEAREGIDADARRAADYGQDKAAARRQERRRRKVR
jgi:hypothetical protein